MYGTSPCTAAIPTTGDFKCYNSASTCQDPANFDGTEELVVRWSKSTEDLPVEIESKPCIGQVSQRPMSLDPGENMGVRESVTVSCVDSLDNMALFDPYISDRAFNTYSKGTYFGKLLAQYDNMEGYEFRVIRGYVGNTRLEMKTRYYIVDSIKSLTVGGQFQIMAKDAAKFLDIEKAQWPKPSTGVLLGTLTDVATTLTLGPVGVGNDEYPLSGTASIGDEKVTFTRVADAITLTGRGLSGSQQVEHSADDTFQLAAVYSAESPADIFDDILTNATDLPSEYIDLPAWTIEVDEHLGRLYSGEIMQPTAVKVLIEELVREAGLNFYVDVELKKFILEVLRQRLPVVNFSDDNIFPSTIKNKPLKEKRISQVWAYYGRKNPLEKMDERKNYSVINVGFTQDSVIALQNNPESIRQIFSRWIIQTNRPAAESVTERLISGFERAPNEVEFRCQNKFPIKTGSTISIQSRLFQDSQGDTKAAFNAYITSFSETEGVYNIKAQEIRFSQISPPGNDRVINVDTAIYDANLRDLHDQIYTSASSGDIVTLEIASGASIGSTSVSNPALDIGSWPAGVVVVINILGRIQGRGGSGEVPDGQDGGDALLTTYPVEITGNGEIWSGGGAGGGGFVEDDLLGGGGAGDLPGNPGATTEDGGNSGSSSGGDPGQDGTDGDVGVAGVAGNAIDGDSFVTISGTPDIKGPRVG